MHIGLLDAALSGRQTKLESWLAAVVSAHSVHDHLVEGFLTSTTELSGVGSCADRQELNIVVKLPKTETMLQTSLDGKGFCCPTNLDDDGESPGSLPRSPRQWRVGQIVGCVRRPDTIGGTIWYKVSTGCQSGTEGTAPSRSSAPGGLDSGSREPAPEMFSIPLVLERRYSEFLALKHEIKVAGLERYSSLFPGKIKLGDDRRLEMLDTWLQTV
eukprot:SAG31_NODE_8132_length_1515_cov_1.117938_3_plen_213_part_01